MVEVMIVPLVGIEHYCVGTIIAELAERSPITILNK